MRGSTAVPDPGLHARSLTSAIHRVARGRAWLSSAVQSEVLNPIGALARLTPHSFFGNYGEYRKTHLWEAGDVLSSLLPAGLDDFTTDEIQAVEERLELTGHPLGGLVADESLQRDREKQRAKQTEIRGHNWELLRQRAEDSGLYLEPLEPTGLRGFLRDPMGRPDRFGKCPRAEFRSPVS